MHIEKQPTTSTSGVCNCKSSIECFTDGKLAIFETLLSDTKNNMEKAGANVFTSLRNSLFVILRRNFKEFILKFQASQFSTP